MTEKKAIVIKVKYPVSNKEASTPQVITEWNIKRISIALGAFFLLLTGLLYVIDGNENQTVRVMPSVDSKIDSGPVANQQSIQNTAILETNQIEDLSKANQKPKAKEIKNKAIDKSKLIKLEERQPHKKTNKNVVRALLTNDVNNKEPGHEISRQIVLNNHPTWVYYFTELKQMNGQRVYHEWLKNNVLISKHELPIVADSWRTSSRKLLSVASKGQWVVRLLDQNGNILNESKFRVNLK